MARLPTSEDACIYGRELERLDLPGRSILRDVRTHGKREISRHRDEFRWGRTLLVPVD